MNRAKLWMAAVVVAIMLDVCTMPAYGIKTQHKAIWRLQRQTVQRMDRLAFVPTKEFKPEALRRQAVRNIRKGTDQQRQTIRAIWAVKEK